MLKKTLLVIPLFFLVVSTVSSQQTKKALSIEQSLSRFSARNPVLSPDGSKAVVTVSQTGSGAGLPATHIWLLDIASKTIRQITYSARSESDPQWSPDGKTLTFLSGRNGVSQIFTMDMDGGEAFPLTKSKTGITAYAWKPGGKTIAFLAEDTMSAAAEKRLADKFDEQVVSEEDKPTRVFTIDIQSRQTKQLTNQHWQVNEMKWMPSGEALLLVVERLPGAELPKTEIVKLFIQDTSVVTLPAPTHSFWGQLNISPDGNSISYTSAREDGPTSHDLFLYSVKSGITKNITGASVDRPILFRKFIDDHHLLATVQRGFVTRLFTIDDKGIAKEYGLDQNISSFDVAANGSLVFESNTATSLSEIWLAEMGQKPVQVSHFNQIFDSITLIKPQYFTYKSFDGLPIEAALYKPANAGSKPLPLIVYIHGGPTGIFSDSYNTWAQLFVQKGYAVFCPNIRGSTGYGWSFITSNRNDWGGNDFKDIMSGVDFLIAKENIDSSRLGITGWSYGGYMAEWAITQTNRFKAAMSGAGLSNLASEFGTENGAAYDHWFFGTPYEQPDNFTKHSPLTYMKYAKTPTLIIQGINDKTDPIGQSQELYRGLRFYNVPTELVLYPREPHGFREIEHNIDFYTRMLAWFDKYLQ